MCDSGCGFHVRSIHLTTPGLSLGRAMFCLPSPALSVQALKKKKATLCLLVLCLSFFKMNFYLPGFLAGLHVCELDGAEMGAFWVPVLRNNNPSDESDEFLSFFFFFFFHAIYFYFFKIFDKNGELLNLRSEGTWKLNGQ